MFERVFEHSTTRSTGGDVLPSGHPVLPTRRCAMVRRHDEPVTVRAAARAAPGSPDDPPHTFVWRGRRYTVCAVLDTWQERRAWWREVGGDGATTDTERRVWRVEAHPPAGPVGVFDLGRDDDHWLLLRAHD